MAEIDGKVGNRDRKGVGRKGVRRNLILIASDTFSELSYRNLPCLVLSRLAPFWNAQKET
jgi:hypothetical protein